MTKEMLAFNKKFVQEEKYKEFISNKYPDKKLAILTCMDTRLIELLPASLGIKNGDAHIIKNAGATVTSPFGSVMRSLLVSIYDLGVEEIIIVGHYNCGAEKLDTNKLLERMRNRGISDEQLKLVEYFRDYKSWLAGFDDVKDSIAKTYEIIRNHPLIPENIKVYKWVIDPKTGQIDVL